MKAKNNTKKFTYAIIALIVLFMFSFSALSLVSKSEMTVNSVHTALHKAEGTAAEYTTVDTESEEYVAPKIVKGYDTHYLDKKCGTHCLLYYCNDEDNLITDASFEEGNGNWKQGTLLNSGVMSVVSSDSARTGNKCLRFRARNLAKDVWCNFYIDVEPNTVYYFTAFAKGELWNSKNRCDLSFGIVDAETQKFVAESYSGSHCEDYQLGISFDNEWHVVRAEVNTGSATRIGIGFTGKSSTAYIDDIYFCKQSDAVEYQFPKRDIEFPTFTDENPDFLGCYKENNLVEDFDFEDVSNTYWKDALGYDITADVVNTNSSAGKALHYSENTYGTGVPKRTYFIKWIDVKPNTEYTFSASYRLLKGGKGWFGVINGSEYLPAAIKKFTLEELPNVGADNWNNVGVTFDSGNFSRVGIALCDKGGECYIDNIRLFEKSNGITLESNPNAQSFRFEYDYTNNPIYSEGTPTDTSELKMNGAYLRYRNDLNEVTIEKESDNPYLKIVKTKDLPTIPLRTTIQLEPDSYYKVSFRYKLKTTKMTAANNWVSKPVFTSCLGEDVWYNHLVNMDESRICQLSGNTLSADGLAYTDNRGGVGMHLESTEEWATYSEIIYTGSIPEGADGKQKYLGMFFIMGDATEWICLDDFVAEKTNKNELQPENATLNYDGTDNFGIYRNLLSLNQIDTENGYLHITDNGRYYDFNAMNFGVMLKPDSNYEIEMKYKLNKCTAKSTQIFGLYEKENFFGSSHTVFSADELIYAFDRTAMTDFNTVKFNFETSSNSGVSKWLTFAAETNVGIDMYIDWIKIKRIVNGEDLIQIVDFENGQRATFTDGTMDSSYEKDSKGDTYLKITANDATDEYPHYVFRTNIELKPDTDYTVSFQYKSTEHWYNHAFWLAGSAVDDWQFRYKPYWTEASTTMYRTSLIGDTLTDSVGYSYRKGKLSLGSSSEWKRHEVTFNTGDIADNVYKYLSLLVQFSPSGNAVREMCIDDIVVIENHESALDGYVIAFKGYDNKPYYLKNSEVKALSETDGYLFKGWFTDKQLTQNFDASAVSDLPYVIYADYEHDFNGDKISNLVDLVRLKKITSGAVTNYVAAADINGDTSVNAVDLSWFKELLLMK